MRGILDMIDTEEGSQGPELILYTLGNGKTWNKY